MGRVSVALSADTRISIAAGDSIRKCSLFGRIHKWVGSLPLYVIDHQGAMTMNVKTVLFDDHIDGHWVLELAGEVTPAMNAHLAEVTLGAPDPDGSPPTQPHIYEYLWTLGHFGDKKAASKAILRNVDENKYDVTYAGDVDIYLLFGNMNEWRISEPIVTVKFMSPAPAGKNFLGRFGSELQTAGKVTGMIPGGGAASKWMEAAAELTAESLPPSEFGWSVSKAAIRENGKPLSGVLWTIPRSMLKQLNGRLSGGLAVSFERSPHQGEHSETGDDVVGNASDDGAAEAEADTIQLRANISVRVRGRRSEHIEVPDPAKQKYLTLKLNLNGPSE